MLRYYTRQKIPALEHQTFYAVIHYHTTSLRQFYRSAKHRRMPYIDREEPSSWKYLMVHLHLGTSPVRTFKHLALGIALRISDSTSIDLR